MKYFLPLPVLLLIHLASIAQLNCRSTEYRQDLISRNPRIAASIQEVEAFTHHQLEASKVAVTGGNTTPSTNSNNGTISPDVITIPVVVHIIYNSAAENITDAQVQSQIDILNRDYRKMNGDTTLIPGYFSPRAADCGFQFVLANADTNGYATSGIVRKRTSIQAFNINDDIKYTAKGGDNAWDRDRYLNIWVGNLTSGILGYSSVVGGPKETDGVTVLFSAFGTMGTAAAPFNLGKTATHEIGHWLNMIHVWGDANCGDDDVADTPPQQQATYGDPSGVIISCGNAPTGNMYMNYMDFTDDIGMHMFTYGQRDRMRTLFAAGGFRYPILSSNAITGTPTPTYGNADADSANINGALFSVYPNPVVSMATVTMTDASLIGSQLEVYNMVGQLLVATRITALDFQLNASSLPKGVYFVRVNDGKHVNAFKMVKI